MTYKITLDYTDPKNIVAASKGDYFYRKGDSYYLLTSRGMTSLRISRKSFVVNDPKYKTTRSIKTLKEYDIGFAKKEELWVKTGSGLNKHGWAFSGTGSPLMLNAFVPTPTPTPTPTATPTPTPTPTGAPTSTPTPTATATPTPSPTSTPTPAPTSTPTPTPTATPTPAPTATPTPTPTATPVATATPTPAPTATPTPPPASATPTPTPTAIPSLNKLTFNLGTNGASIKFDNVTYNATTDFYVAAYSVHDIDCTAASGYAFDHWSHTGIPAFDQGTSVTPNQIAILAADGPYTLTPVYVSVGTPTPTPTGAPTATPTPTATATATPVPTATPTPTPTPGSPTATPTPTPTVSTGVVFVTYE